MKLHELDTALVWAKTGLITVLGKPKSSQAMRNSLTLFLLICSPLVWGQQTKKKTPKPTSATSSPIIDLSPDNWEHQAGKVEFIDHKGTKAIKLNPNSGEVFLKDYVFKDGTIEFDVEVNQASPFPAVYFRRKGNNAEHVYLRTGASNRPQAVDAVQYAAVVNGVNLWDLAHEYQTSCNIKINDWNHLKLVVNGAQLRVYVNNLTEPVLDIPALEGNTSEGQIGLSTGFPGEAVFANLTVTTDTEGLMASAGADLTRHDTRYLRHWQVTKPASLPVGTEITSQNLPQPGAEFERIPAERRGLVNLSRKFGGDPNRRYVWLKATLKAEQAQSQMLKLGFSDEVWVYLNRVPVYVDKDNYIQGMRKSPNGRISLDNSQFPIHLKQGENELLIAVANNFYGWGIMARLEHLEGVTILK